MDDHDVLQPHELAEMGLGAAFGPSPTTTQEVHVMNFQRTAPGGMYTAEEDVIETLPDGRTIQVATKGTQMPMADAIRLGLVKEAAPQGPSETKAETPTAPPEPEEDEEPKPKGPGQK